MNQFTTKNPWSEERKEEASKLWVEGFSTSQIAAIMGMSRNSIIGVANRNRDRFPAKPKGQQPVKQIGEAVPRKPRKQAPSVRSTFALEWSSSLKNPQSVDFVTLPGEPVSKKLTLDQLGSFECHWATDRPDNQHLFCGHEVEKGERYCGFHVFRSLGRDARAKRYAA